MEHLFHQNLFPLKANGKEVVQVVAVVGKWHGHRLGSFEITPDDLINMQKNAVEQKTEVVIDYEHQTLNGDIAPASGWISKLEVKDNELLATIKWTPKAIQHIKDGEYKYLSPVYAFDSRDPKTDGWIGIKLHSVALTNTPFIDELGEVKANKQKEEKTKSTVIPNKELDETKNALASAKVELAINQGKIQPDQKEWALTYCKENQDGFDAFIKSVKEQRVVPNNNQFRNNKDSNTKEDFDVVAMALESRGE